MPWPPPIREVLFDSATLSARIEELGAEITAAYRGRSPLVVGVLNGCFPFLADLVREIDLPVEVDFVAVSSYGRGTESSGEVRILKDLGAPAEGRDIILIEDIADSGLTLRFLADSLRRRQPASLEICVLLDKPERRKVSVDVRFAGFPCPDVFVVGYGLDHAGLYRNLPYVAALDVATNPAP